MVIEYLTFETALSNQRPKCPRSRMSDHPRSKFETDALTFFRSLLPAVGLRKIVRYLYVTGKDNARWRYSCTAGRHERQNLKVSCK